MGTAPQPRELPDGRKVTSVEELWPEWWKEYIAGMSQRAIAEAYGVTQKTVEFGLQAYLEQNFDERMIVMARDLDIARLEALIDRHWANAVESGKIQSSKLLIKLIEVRARILGYGAPKRVEHSGHVEHSVEPELAGLLSRLHEQNAAVRGSLSRTPPKIPGRSAEDDVVEAEVVDDEPEG